MAITTLRPAADGTTTGWTRVPASGTFASKIVDDPNASDADTSYVLSPNVAAGTLFVDLGDVPAGFDPAAINSITIRVAHRRLNTPMMAVDDGTVQAYLTRADETTLLSTQPTAVASPIQAGYQLTTFTPAPTGAHTLADWNGARLALVFTPTSQQTVDTVNQIRVTAVEVEIDYTPIVVPSAPRPAVHVIDDRRAPRRPLGLAMVMGLAAVAAPAELSATLSGSGGLGATLSTSIEMEAQLTATATQVADLSTSIEMAAVLTGEGTLVADLTVPASTAGKSATVIVHDARVRRAAQPGLALVMGLAPVPVQNVDLAATLTGSGTVLAALSTEIEMASALTGSGTVLAALSTEIEMAAILAGTATQVAALSTEIEMAAVLAAAGTISADLTVVPGTKSRNAVVLLDSWFTSSRKPLARTGQALVYGLTPVPPLASAEFAVTLAGSGALAGSLSTSIRFASVLTGAATCAADLLTTNQIASQLVGSGTLAAALTAPGSQRAPRVIVIDARAHVPLRHAAAELLYAVEYQSVDAASLSATLTGAGTLSAALTTSVRFAASLNGSGSCNAGLSTAIRLASALTGAGALTADLSTSTRLAAAMVGSAVVAGDLSSPNALQTALMGTGAFVADLSTSIRFASALNGSVSVVGSLGSEQLFTASLAGSGALSGALRTSIEYAAVLAGTGDLSAEISTALHLAAALTGSASLTSVLQTTPNATPLGPPTSTTNVRKTGTSTLVQKTGTNTSFS